MFESLKKYVSVTFQIFLKYLKYKSFSNNFEDSQAYRKGFKNLTLPNSQKEKGYAISMVTFD